MSRFKAKASFCTPLLQIEENVADCEENDLYLKHGEECLDKLDAESKSVSDLLPALFSKNADQRQAGKYDSSIHDEKMAAAGLTYLIGTTQLAMKEIEGYRSNLADPPDADEPDVNGGNVEAYRSSVDCFATNRSNLTSLLADFDRRLNQLRATKKIADAHAATSGKNLKGVDAIDSASGQKLLTGTAAGSAKVPSGKAPKKASNITGVEEDAKKRNK